MSDYIRPFRRAAKHTIHDVFGVCFPIPTWQEGADHTGIDAYLKCPICGKRTETHVECERVTPEIRRILKGEWRPGNLTMKRRYP